MGNSIFSKIIAGEIPSYKIDENDHFLAFLDVFPLVEGHVLVVPKKETDKLFDVDDQLLSEWLVFEKCKLKNAPTYCQPKIENNVVECQVIHIDRFENVVINITREQFYEVAKERPFQIQFMRNETINEISTHYHNVKEGDKLCRFNSAGYLEIAINRGKAASLFGLKLHREQHLMYNTIKIFFG